VKPGQEMLVSHLQSCIDSLSGMLKDLLDVSKLDAGVLEPTISNFSMDSFGASLMTIYDAKAADKGLQLRWRHDAHITVSTDRQMLHRLIGNLIDNALAYTDQGGVLVATRRRAGVLWLEVWDTGVGMAQDQIPVIFEEFRQLGDNARNRGSGLGLAIVIKMTKLLGLEIRARSRLGRGSVFSITLPEGDTLVPVPQPTPTAVPALIIGLVEDNRQVLDALVMTLEVLGHKVFTGTSGSELLNQLGQQAPDVVISDFRLGAGETGLDVIAAARARFGLALPAIILTGDSAPNLVSKFGNGVVVLIKPVQMGEVQAALVRATRKSVLAG
jgi:CheY-like chemotaxis protein